MQMVAGSKADAILNKGRAHLDAGRLQEAEKCFRQAARTSMTPTALNNWALCRHLAGDHQDALTLLQPLLSMDAPLPFTRALAGMAYMAQGQMEQALKQIHRAIRDFDRGLVEGGATDPGWIEYTAMIKRVVGDAGDHRLVLDLHGRWPGRNLPSGAFAAGVAAFNLGQFTQASEYWRQISDPQWVRLMETYVLVADLAEQGVVPSFALEYEPTYEWDPRERSLAAVRRLAAKGAARVLLLATAFSAPDTNSQVVDALISQTGSWGVDLGQRLLAGSDVPIGVKVGAAKALTDLGLFSEGQEIPIVHGGRPTTVVLKPMGMVAPNPELDRKVAEAIRLRDSGRRDAAYELLTELEGRGIIYPPAIATLANLMRDRGELEGARAKLELADRLMPGNPAIQFNLAGLWLQLEQPQRALEVAQRIQAQGTTNEFQRALQGLMNVALERMGFITDPTVVADAYRADAEERPVSPDLRLRAALRQIPVQWLNATADMYHLEERPRRPERERLLAEAILEPSRVKRLLTNEDSETQDAFRFLLEKGGWVKLQALTRRFGTLDGDGYWWDEQPPVSPVGRLRLLGLVFVGRARIDGKMHKVAVVPVELRGARFL